MSDILYTIGLILLIVWGYYSHRRRRQQYEELNEYIRSPNPETIQATSQPTISERPPTPYSGTAYQIKENEYATRLIISKKTSPAYILNSLKSYGELSGSEEYKEHSFGIGALGDYLVLKVGRTIRFSTFHNLVGWVGGHEPHPYRPEVSIGFAQHITDPEKDYACYIDPNIKSEDTGIGAFRNGDSFFIYLPDAFEEDNALTITSDLDLSMSELIDENGLNIQTLTALKSTPYSIRINTDLQDSP